MQQNRLKKALTVAALSMLAGAALLAIQQRKLVPVLARETPSRHATEQAAEAVSRPSSQAGQPAARDDGPPNVAGVVLGADGVPVERAVVQVGEIGEGWVPFPDRYTDARGRFALRLRPGQYRLSARSGPWVGAYPNEVIVAPDAVPETEVVIRLERGLTIAGTITTGRSAPVASARIRAALDNEHLAAILERGEGKESDDDGAYRIEGLLPGRYRVTVNGDGFAVAERELRLESDQAGVDFVLFAEAVVEGHVTTAAGEPVAEAWVRAQRANGQDRLNDLGTVLSDERGAFRFGGLPAGEVVLEAKSGSLKTATPAQGRAEARITLSARDRRQLELKLTEGCTISGIVVDEEEHPVADVSVSAGWMEGRTTTGADGRFRLVGLVRGRYFLNAYARDGRTGGETGELETDHLDNITVKLAGIGHSLRGVVLAPDGSPAWGAKLTAWPSGPGNLGGGQTGDDGRFIITKLSNTSYRVVAQKEGFPDTAGAEVPADSEVVIHLAAPSSIAGVVADARGQPVRDYSITLHRNHVSFLFDSIEPRTFHDAGGAFRFGSLGAGTYVVEVHGVDSRVGLLENVTVAAGEDRRGLRIIVASGATLQGRVVDHRTGAGVPDVIVDFGISSVHTGEDGSFHIKELARGPIEITFLRTGYATERRKLKLDGDLSLGNVHLLSGNVDYRPVAYDGIEAELRDGRPIVELIGPGSPADTAGIRPGDAILSINGVDCADLGNQAVNLLLAGPIGATVRLMIAPGGNGAARAVTLQLAAFPH